MFYLESVSVLLAESDVVEQRGRQPCLPRSSSAKSFWSDRSADSLPGQVCQVLRLGPEGRHGHLQLEKDWAEHSGKSSLAEHHP